MKFIKQETMRMTNFNSFILWTVSFLIFIYFALTNILTHFGSIVLSFLFFLSIIVFIKNDFKIILTKYEKFFFYIITAFICLHVFSLLQWNLFKPF